MVNFNKTVKYILEEAATRPPFEMLSELNYSSILLLQNKQHYIGRNAFGKVFDIKKGKLFYGPRSRANGMILIKGRNEWIKNIKKNWRKGHIVGGGELRRYLDSASREKVINDDDIKYVVNDLSILPKFTTLFTGKLVYLEPTDWEQAPQEVKNVFTDMFEEM